MYSLAHVIMPFGQASPIEALRASLAPYQYGGPHCLPGRYLAFIDETDRLRQVHESRCRFSLQDVGCGGGLNVSPGNLDRHVLNLERVTAEMHLFGLQRWDVRFADTMDLDTFFDRFGTLLSREASTGRYGRMMNPLGHWGWWDLGGRFNGYIAGPKWRGEGSPTRLSCSDSINRRILHSLQVALEKALGHVPDPALDICTDRNVELVSTLLSGPICNPEHGDLSVVVLPPGSVQDAWRWLECWPDHRPREASPWLGLPRDAKWSDVVRAAYERFAGHWAAGVTFHF